MNYNTLCIHCFREKKRRTDPCPYCGFDPGTYRVNENQLLPFTILHGEYLIGEVVGHGGFGIVYRAFDLNLHNMVAIKELLPEGLMSRTREIVPGFSEPSRSTTNSVTYLEEPAHINAVREKFVREARVLARLEGEQGDEGIVRVHALFSENGTDYMVMEFLNGQTLRDYLKQVGKIDWNDLIELLRPCMRALARLHLQGIVHRDISPDNIMILAHSGRPKLLDFGNVKVTEKDPDNPSTKLPAIKRGYSPIEQYSVKGKIGPETDIYSLCATLYKCVTGITPPEPTELIQSEVKKPSELGAVIPQGAEKALLKGLSIRAADRFHSMEELSAALFEESDGSLLSAEKAGIEPEKRNLLHASDLIKGKNGDAAEPVSVSRNTTGAGLGKSGSVRSEVKKDVTGYQQEVRRESSERSDQEEKPPKIAKQDRLIVFLIAGLAVIAIITAAYVLVSSRSRQRERESQKASEKVYRAESERESQAESEKAYRAESEKESQVESKKAYRAESEKESQAESEKAYRAESERESQAESEKVYREESEKESQAESEKAYREESEKAYREESEKESQAESEKAYKAESEKAYRKESEKESQAASEKAYREESEKESQAASEKAYREESEKESQAASEKAYRAESEKESQAASERAYRAESEKESQAASEKAAELLKETAPRDWTMNLLKEEHGAIGELDESGSTPEAVETAFGVSDWKRDRIKGIYVLSSLDEMPSDAVDLSAAGDRGVMGWMDENRNLYIAGQGGVKAGENAAALFAWYKNAEVIDLGGNLHTDDTTDFSYMFYHCPSLKTLNLAGMNTSNARTFTKMFVGCKKLKTLDLSSFETSKVESFYAMFAKCLELQELHLESFETSNARTFAMMFWYCESVEKIYLSPALFDTSRAESMGRMFSRCLSLEFVDVSRFQMQNVRSIQAMFSSCARLPDLDFSGWDLRSVTNHEHVFIYSSLEAKYGTDGQALFG